VQTVQEVLGLAVLGDQGLLGLHHFLEAVLERELHPVELGVEVGGDPGLEVFEEFLDQVDRDVGHHAPRDLQTLQRALLFLVQITFLIRLFVWRRRTTIIQKFGVF